MYIHNTVNTYCSTVCCYCVVCERDDATYHLFHVAVCVCATHVVFLQAQDASGREKGGQWERPIEERHAMLRYFQAACSISAAGLPYGGHIATVRWSTQQA